DEGGLPVLTREPDAQPARVPSRVAEVRAVVRAAPAVGVDAAARREEPVRLRQVDEPPRLQVRADPVGVFRDARSREVHAGPILHGVVVDGPGVARIGRPVDLARRRDVRRAGGARAADSPVEARDALDRAVPELEQPLRTLIRHTLTEVERRLAAGRVVDPAERTLEDVLEVAADR